MQRSDERLERRALKRIRVARTAIAVVRAKPTLILGQIQDISPEGLSFTYISNPLQAKEASELELLVPEEKYHLSGLAFETISDSVIPKENPFSMITMSRRGVRFLQLTPRQRFQLQDLMLRIVSRRNGAHPPANRTPRQRPPVARPAGCGMAPPPAHAGGEGLIPDAVLADLKIAHQGGMIG